MPKKVKHNHNQKGGMPGNYSRGATAADGKSPAGGHGKRVKKIPAKLRDSYRESGASDCSDGSVDDASEDDDGDGSGGSDDYDDDDDEASDEASDLRKHKKRKAGFNKLGGLKRLRQGSIMANAGEYESAEHALRKVVRTSATVHLELEAERTDKYYEWEKTAKGFKRRIIGAQGWAVYSFFLYFCWAKIDRLPETYFSVWFMPPQEDADAVQGLRRRLDLRASAGAVTVQGLRRLLDLRASAAAVDVQGMRRLLDLRASAEVVDVQRMRRLLDLRASACTVSVQ